MWLTEQVGVKAPRDFGQADHQLLDHWPTGLAGKHWRLTRDREEDNLLVRPLLRSIVVNRNATGRNVAALLRPGNISTDGGWLVELWPIAGIAKVRDTETEVLT